MLVEALVLVIQGREAILALLGHLSVSRVVEDVTFVISIVILHVSRPKLS